MKKEEFEILLNADKETEHLEFKEAKTQFNFKEGRRSVCGYCIALANERGGNLVLGVKDDKIPRVVVGTKAFKDVAKLKKDIFRQIRRRVDISEIGYNRKRVLIINISSRPIGELLFFKGIALMRVGDSLESMTSDQIKKITNEYIKDYSSELIEKVTYKDLSLRAIKELRKILKHSTRVEKKVDNFTNKQLLTDLGLIFKNKITIAALVLLGKREAIKKYLPHSEIRYGYKQNENEIRNQDMKIFDECYFISYNKVWDKINSRNLSIYIPQGLRVFEKKAFDEETIREAINNSIIHRDYSEQETNFIIQTPTKIKIINPGGLLSGITITNMIDESKTRNKLIADVLFKCEFVEQFGNGVNLMVKNQLSLGKNLPDYSKTDKHRVSLEIDGKIQDIEFAKYVYLVAMKKKKSLNDQELLILNKIKNNERIKSEQITRNLLDLGIIESLGRGKYLLSKEYYSVINKKGEYTRKVGLDRETHKKLILEHIRKWKKGYMYDFIDVLKDVPKHTINKYLSELKAEKKIELVGNPRIVRGEKKAYWGLTK